MLNEKKVILMTKMALLESKEQESLHINRFRKRDYVWAHVLKMILAVTAAFVLVAGVGVFVYIQKAELAVKMDAIPFFFLGLLMVYILILAINIGFACWIYGRRFDDKKKQADRLAKYVAHLDRFYEKETGND